MGICTGLDNQLIPCLRKYRFVSGKATGVHNNFKPDLCTLTNYRILTKKFNEKIYCDIFPSSYFDIFIWTKQGCKING